MNTGVRRSRSGSGIAGMNVDVALLNREARQETEAARVGDATEMEASAPERKIRVFLAAENRLVRDTLSRMIEEGGDIEVIGRESEAAFHPDSLAGRNVEVLLLTSRSSFQEDLEVIRQARATTPEVKILLVGMPKDEGEFLQCVRAGVSGYLLRDASAADVIDGIRAVQAGESVCPGRLCTTLFQYFEREGAPLPCASVHQRLGLTRREQQLIPLIAKGLTNKEIANYFCLSEQTVKNHLYRMKHKVGAEDRLGIVQRYRTQGFLL